MYKVHVSSASKTLMKTEWRERKKTQTAKICEGRRERNEDLLFLQEEEKLKVQSRDSYQPQVKKICLRGQNCFLPFPSFPLSLLSLITSILRKKKPKSVTDLAPHQTEKKTDIQDALLT